ncbi:hypothetical protein TIFTF001_030964 [Ficus carica]|uniref:Uncharacterized protein n=1 Tax=Ficus carica TaxID=3494 RepID=A0AA88J4V2_FICCA|nr:hypothetical protein TIFTF001_030964 [Ficus carica]
MVIFLHATQNVALHLIRDLMIIWTLSLLHDLLKASFSSNSNSKLILVMLLSSNPNDWEAKYKYLLTSHEVDIRTLKEVRATLKHSQQDLKMTLKLEVALTNVAASQEEIANLNSSIQAQTEEAVHVAVSDLSDLKTSVEFDAEY